MLRDENYYYYLDGKIESITDSWNDEIKKVVEIAAKVVRMSWPGFEEIKTYKKI